MFPSIFWSFVSIRSLLQLLIPLLWARIKAVQHGKAKQTPLNLMILKFVPHAHLGGGAPQNVTGKRKSQTTFSLMTRNWIQVYWKLTFNYVAPNDILISFL